MIFVAQCVAITGLSIAVMSATMADTHEDSAPDTSTLIPCRSNLPVKANVIEVPGCITDFFEQYSKDKNNAELDASYALGVMFQRDLAGKYEEFDYARFLLGVLEEADTTMRFSDTQLENKLKTVLISKAEKSDNFVREFAERADVKEWKGIYYIDRSEPGKEIEVETSLCAPDQDAKEPYNYTVSYHRLDLNNTGISGGSPSTCLRVNDDEVIRGWRTALRKMNAGSTWELVVPAPLAYGDVGAEKTSKTAGVEKGEALRFIIRLHEKS